MSATTSTFWYRPLLYLLGAGALLGVSTNLGKIAGELSVPPLAFLSWSVLCSAVLLSLLQWLRGDLPAVNRTTVLYFFVAGLVTLALSNLVIYAAIPRVGAGFVALTLAFPPLLTYLGALTFGLEGFRKDRAAGVALALSGAVVLAIYKFSEPDASVFWIVLALIAPLLLAVGNVYRSAAWPEGESPAALAPGMLVAASVLLFFGGGIATAIGAPADIFSLAVPLADWRAPAIVAAQTLTLSVQFLLFFQLQASGGATYLSLLGSVGAVIGVPIAVLLLGENWPGGLVLSGLLILAGVALLTYGGQQQNKNNDND